MKKFLSILLVVALMISIVLIGLMSITASAATSDIEGYYTYTISNGEATIVNVDTNISGNVEVPQNFGEYPVVKIGYKAFANCSNITAITIPDSVKEIEGAAFFGCNKLVEMTIPFVGQYASPVFDTSKTSHEVKEQLFGYIFGTEEFNGSKEIRQYYGTYNSTGTGLYSYVDRGTYASDKYDRYVSFLYEAKSYKKTDYDNNTNNTKTTVDRIISKAFYYKIFSNGTSRTIWYASKSNPSKRVSYFVPSSLEKVTVTGDYSLYFGAFSNSGLKEIYIESKTATISTAAFIDSCWKKELPDDFSLQDYFDALIPTKIHCYPDSKLEKYFLAGNLYVYSDYSDILCGFRLDYSGGGYYIPPESPTIEQITDVSVTLTKDNLMQYSLNGTNWQDSNVFTGLKPNTQYTFYQRYKKRTDNVTIEASEKSEELIVTTKSDLKKITIDTLPSKLSYVTCTDTLSVLGGKIKLEYANGESDIIEMNSSMISGFDNTVLGSQTLTVSFNNKTTTFDIDILDKNISSFYLYTTPTKLIYEKGDETIDVSGGKICVYYSNAPYEIIKLNLSMISGFDGNKLGKQSITVSFRGLTKTFDVTVKEHPEQPLPPTINSKTANSITLTKIEGYAYSLDNATWTTNNVFSNLTAQTKYTFYQRKLETETEFSSVSSSALEEYTRPSLPILISKNSTSITLQEKEGYEFSIDGINWQVNNVFDNLEPNSQYQIYQRLKGLDNPSSALAVSTKKTQEAPSKPQIQEMNESTVVLTHINGYEYSMDGINWQSGNTFRQLSVGNVKYSFYQRRAANASYDVSLPSEPVIVKITCTQTPKRALLEMSTSTSITLKHYAGYEYSIDGVNWQSTTTFENLKSGVTYNFYQRIAETDDVYASAISDSRNIMILSAGDLDSDEDISDWDGVLLARYLAGWNVINLPDSVMDIDGDGEVNDWDGVMFDRYLAGWDVEVFLGTGEAVATYSIKYTDDKNAINNNPTTYKSGQCVSLQPLNKEHYVFNGWYYMGNIISELTGKEGDDIILIAQWTPIQYSVTYQELKGNNNAFNPKYITVDDGTLDLFDLPATNGYAFDGWVDERGKKVTSISVLGDDIVLTATWRIDSAAIIDIKHNYDTECFEVSINYSPELTSSGNFQIVFEINIKNISDKDIGFIAHTFWFNLYYPDGTPVGSSSVSSRIMYTPVGEIYNDSQTMYVVPKGEFVLYITD